MDYNKFIEFWQGVVRQSVYEQGQELIAYAESLQVIDPASLSSFYIKHNGPDGYIPTPESESEFAKRCKTLWAARIDW
jgi:hypothetical protein